MKVVEAKEEGGIPSKHSRTKPRVSRHERKKAKRKRKQTPAAGDAKGADHAPSKRAKKGKNKKASVQEEDPRPKECSEASDESKSNIQDYEHYRLSHQPTPLSEEEKAPKHKSLGKWFPKAMVVKSSISYGNEPTSAKASILLFYQYVRPPWNDAQLQKVTQYLLAIKANRPNLGGRIRVAKEGLNATLSAADVIQGEGDQAASTLRHFAMDLQSQFDCFASTDFKFHDNLFADRHFKDFRILPVQELVFYGLSDQEAPLDKTGQHLLPQDFHSKLREPDTVVIDVRNHYEAALGRFDGQENKTTGEASATYIDPKMRKSTDFITWLQQDDTRQQLKDKQVLLYCTGGVRCERASAHLNHSLQSSVKGVYQLQGGIERYLKEIPTKESLWRGKNFTFDKREAIDASDANGDGGVISKCQADCETKCSHCHKPWDRYVGKKKCHTCGVPILLCPTCLTLPKADTSECRCPLCTEQGITIPARDLSMTDNGKRVAQTDATSASQKAAPSVLKWGGGHAQQRKMQKRVK